MSNPLWTLGIILSLGTAGCAGLGSQQASSLTAQVRKEQGLDGLWMEERKPARGIEPQSFAGSGLGGLWDRDEPGTSPAQDRAYYQSRSGGDLWNPASVTRSWESKRPRLGSGISEGLLFSDASKEGRRSRAKSARW